MRIAIVTTYPPGSGSLNEYAFHFVEALKNKTEVQEIILLTDNHNGEPGRHRLPGTGKTRVFDRPCWTFNQPASLLRIAQAVREERPDVVLFNLQFASFGDKKIAGGFGLLTPWVTRILGFPTVVLLHNIIETVDLEGAGFGNSRLGRGLIRFFGTVLTRALLQANLVALTIPKYVEILQARYRVNNVVLLPHGTFDDLPQPSRELPAGPKQILTFGKFGTYKKVEDLIGAFERVQETIREPLELVIAGTDSPNAPGYLAAIQQQHAGKANLRFTGYVEEEDVPTVFRQASVVVFPYTATTGSSGVLHQAGSFGKAVVIPEIGDFVDLIQEEGYQGEIFLPGDAESMAEAIRRLLANPAHRERLGLKNYYAAKGLPIQEVVDWYLIHLRALLAEQPIRSTLNLLDRGKSRFPSLGKARGI